MEFETLTYEVTEGVAVITFNRPDDANALNPQQSADLYNAAVAAENDPEVRAVLITGNGKMFCAGGDLKTFYDAGEAMGATLTDTATGLHNAISRFSWMDAPVVIAVNGTAAGAGFSLALTGDYAFASEKAKFTMAYTAAGLTPDGSSTYFLAKHIGLRRAKELVLTNRLLTAQEAEDWGIINKVVPADQLMDEAMALAKTFAKGPTKAYGKAKRLVLRGATESLETQMDAESRGIVAMTHTRDGKHGIESFVNKQKPDYKGE